MRDDEWATWAEWHAAVFGLTSETDVLMLNAWRDVFEACNYSAGELSEASQYLAKTKPPRWRSDHLPAIHERILEVRWKHFQDEQARLDKDQSIAKPCELCSGTGVAVVPHLGFVADGVWLPPQPEYAVACRCFAGQKRISAFLAIDVQEVEKKRLKCLMSLLTYEQKNPFWQDQMAQKKSAKRAEMNARNLARAGDDRHGPLTKDLREVFQRIPKGELEE